MNTLRNIDLGSLSEGFRIPMPPYEQFEILKEYMLGRDVERPAAFLQKEYPEHAHGWLLVPKFMHHTDPDCFYADYEVAIDRIFCVLAITKRFDDSTRSKFIRHLTLDPNVAARLAQLEGRTTEDCMLLGYRFAPAGTPLRKNEFFLGPYEFGVFLATHLRTDGPVTSHLLHVAGARVRGVNGMLLDDPPMCFWWDSEKHVLRQFLYAGKDFKARSCTIVGIIP